MSDAEQYLTHADRLEEAIYWHTEWFGRVVRHLLFRTQPEPDLIAVSAHTLCHFGLWLKEAAQVLRDHEPWYSDLIAQHQRMHQQGRELLVCLRDQGALEREIYEEFAETQSLFFSTLHGLFRSLVEAATLAEVAARTP